MIRALQLGWGQGLVHSLNGVAIEHRTRGQSSKSWHGSHLLGTGLGDCTGCCGAQDQLWNVAGVRVGRGGSLSKPEPEQPCGTAMVHCSGVRTVIAFFCKPQVHVLVFK